MSKKTNVEDVLNSLNASIANHRQNGYEDDADAVRVVRDSVRSKATISDETISKDRVLPSLVSLKGSNTQNREDSEEMNQVISRITDLINEKFDDEIDLGALNRSLRSLSGQLDTTSEKAAVDQVRTLLTKKTTRMNSEIDSDSLRKTLHSVKGMIANEYGRDSRALDSIDRVISKHT